MNRRSVIRCILGLAAAPKILAEMDFKPPIKLQSSCLSLLEEPMNDMMLARLKIQQLMARKKPIGYRINVT